MASSVSAPNPLAETHPTATATAPAPATAETGTAQAHADPEPPRPQAGPLPSKRGEIGYVEGVHDRGEPTEGQASASTTSLPARHPADRDAPPAADAGAPPSGDAPRAASPNASTNTAGKRSLISFLTPKRIPTFGGLRLTSISILLLQVCLFGATIAGWVLIVQHMQKSKPAPAPSSGSDSTSDATSSGASSVLSQTSSQIFVHVAFGITALAELIFIERSVFRLRAERYGYKHPGEILPRSRPSQESASTGMAFAPWNRPPLPTYAAALAQSGVGTGDVEDNIIAIPPPPAYGNTRGSTLLLAGFMSNASRSQRLRDSTGSAASRASRTGRRDRLGPGGEDEEDRPKSYMSVDPEWEIICDADRALQLEETLARLEEGGGAGGGRPGARSS
ncbi:hypothetical protein BV20DRAFT_962303 [Pilatotrama ljubarskyi]|nr:hypothetical protein BV20DRAFT_962303 [Pilatotrama ljubarskyi]